MYRHLVERLADTEIPPERVDLHRHSAMTAVDLQKYRMVRVQNIAIWLHPLTGQRLNLYFNLFHWACPGIIHVDFLPYRFLSIQPVQSRRIGPQYLCAVLGGHIAKGSVDL